MRTFTNDELRKFSGRDGAPAYVAYKGKVYDVTRSPSWEKGAHYEAHNAGEDLTEAMDDAPHGGEAMDDFPVVGTVEEE